MGDVAAPTAPGTSEEQDDLVHRLLSRPRLVVLGATLVMAVASLWGLTRRAIWLDEGFTVMHTDLPSGTYWEIVFDREMNAVLHSTVIHLLPWGEGSLWALRLPSAIAVILLVPATYLLGRRLFDPAVGALAAVLITSNGFVVEYGQEGRGYALLMLVAATSSWLFVRALQEDDAASWAGWVLVSCLLGYAHFFGVLVLVAQVAALGVRWIARRTVTTPWKPALIGLLCIGLAHLPIAWFFLTGGSKGQNDGLPPFTVERFVGIWVRLAGNFGVPLVVLVAIPCVAAVWALWQSRHHLDERAWAIAFCVLGVSLPVVLVALVSLVDTLFVARYFVEVIPLLALLAAFGLGRLRPTWAQAVVGTGIVLLGAAAVVTWHGTDSREETDAMVAFLDEPGTVQPGDVVAFDPWFARIPTEVQLGDHDDLADRLVPAYPAEPWGEWLPDDDPGEVDADVLAELDADRVWVVQRRGVDGSTIADLDTDLAAALDALGYQEVEAERFEGLALTLYDRTG
jgi:mannosyltransferase